MSAEELVSEQEVGYPVLRFLADLLTLTRLAIAVSILCLGLLFGPVALRTAIILVFVGWLTDTIDGPLARSSGSRQTWVARVDVPADNALVFSFFLFIVITGLYPVIPALALVAAIGLIVLIRPTYPVIQMVSAPFFALPIVLSFCAGWLVGAIYVVFLTALVIARWDQLTGDARTARCEAASLSGSRSEEE